MAPTWLVDVSLSNCHSHRADSYHSLNQMSGKTHQSLRTFEVSQLYVRDLPHGFADSAPALLVLLGTPL